MAFPIGLALLCTRSGGVRGSVQTVVNLFKADGQKYKPRVKKPHYNDEEREGRVRTSKMFLRDNNKLIKEARRARSPRFSLL